MQADQMNFCKPRQVSLFYAIDLEVFRNIANLEMAFNPLIQSVHTGRQRSKRIIRPAHHGNLQRLR